MEDGRAKDSEATGQRGTGRYRVSWTEEIRKKRGSETVASLPNTSLISLECSDGSIHFHLHINRFLLVTATAACVSGNLLNINMTDHHNADGIQKTERTSADTHTQQSASPKQTHSPAPCNGIPLIPSARC